MNGTLRLRYRHGYGDDRGAMDAGESGGSSRWRCPADGGRRTRSWPPDEGVSGSIAPALGNGRDLPGCDAWARDPQTVTANCLHPATYMATTMVRQSGVTPTSTVEEGAEAILNLAVADELDGRSGQFYNGLRPSKANPQAYDDAARERLRVLSLQLTGLA